MEFVPALPPSAAEIRARHERLLARLRERAAAAGHDPERLRIVGVTKTWPADVAVAAYEAGLVLLGESRVQEAEPKVAAVPAAEWHFVGRLQSNKVRRAVRAFAVMHSVDSVDLLRRIDAVATAERRPVRVLLQVNLTGSPTTAGFAPGDLLSPSAERAVADLRGAAVVGLMTIARNGAPEPEARDTFDRLRTLRDDLQSAVGIELPELSMGMSADAGAAAAAGATLVRIGTALFGSRG
jgi:PLP dependent protein